MANSHRFPEDTEVWVNEKVRGKVIGATFITNTLELAAVAVDRDDPEVAALDLPYPTMLVPVDFLREVNGLPDNVIEVDFQNPHFYD